MVQKILVVEDDPRSMALVGMTLRPQGYAVLGASDGESALRMAERHTPDLVIMDIQLPGIDGVETTRRLREIPALRRTPVVAMTAYAMKGDEERVMGAGCDAYVSKPINTRELPRLVARLLQERGARDGERQEDTRR